MLLLSDLGLKEKSGDLLYERYVKVLNDVLSDLESDSNIKGVITCGSFVKGLLKEGSDIDVVVIYPSCDEIYMEEREINGVEVSLICCSEALLEEEFVKEGGSFMRRISHLLSAGVLCVGDSSLKDLVARAHVVINSPVPDLTEKKLKDISSFIEKQKKVVSYYRNSNDEIGAVARLSFSAQELLHLYFKLTRQIIPNWKWMGDSLGETPFRGFVHKFYFGASLEAKCEAFLKMIDYVENLLCSYSR